MRILKFAFCLLSLVGTSLLLFACGSSSSPFGDEYGSPSASSSSSSSASSSGAEPPQTAELSKSRSLAGEIWTTAGQSLYTFKNDTHLQSNCNGVCADNWPPLLAEEGTEYQYPFATLERDSGEKQVALRGKPLYTYISDTEDGDINGDGLGDVWYLAYTGPAQLALDASLLASAGQVLQGLYENGAVVSELVEKSGFSLYTFANDIQGQSNCTSAGCINSWPPLLADQNANATEPYSLIDRADSNYRQWAYNGSPLYFYSGDNEAGQTLGADISNWALARPNNFIFNDSQLVALGKVHLATPGDTGEVITQIAKDGFSLYTFDNDAANQSNCFDNCLANWPALMAADGAQAFGEFTLIDRGDSKQWAFEGQPLYFYRDDVNPQDKLGDGLGGVWHLAEKTSATQLDEDDDSTYDSYGQYSF